MIEDGLAWLTEIQIRYPLITETALSPDGRQVVYGVREPLMTTDESRYLKHLYLASVEVEDPIQLTCGSCTNHTARWSPDGRFLAFLSDRGSSGDVHRANVYAMRVAGGEPWALTSFGQTDVVDLAWSPDGSRLAILMADPPNDEKSAATKAKDDAILWDVDFDFQHVYVVPFAVTPRQLPQPNRLTKGRVHICKLAWMPDGDRLALTTQPTPGADDWTSARLVVVPATLPEDGTAYGPGDVRVVGDVPAHQPQPLPSPDGVWIACQASETPVRWAGSWGAVLFPVDGREQNPRPLARTPDEKCLPIGWSSDGDRLFVFEGSSLAGHVLALPVDGGPATQVHATSTVKFAFGQPVGDSIPFAEEDFGRPNAIRILDVGSGDTRPVAAPPLPADWPTDRFPEVEVLAWEGPGGMPIEGFVAYPLGYEPGVCCPLVVAVHGGPAGAFDRRYLAWPDRHCDTLALVGNGVGVLRANPRGSSNYGKSFRYANLGDWGNGDFGDILAGVDLLVERGVADPDRLGIMGWSYGGYMASWAITHSDRFKAAVVGAGVTNLLSMAGTGDIPGFLADYFDGEPWDALQTYLAHSAMGSADGLVTPTLVQHGEDDIRVPLSQGRELYNALKRQGVPCQMVIYPRQGHGIAEPRLRIDVRRRAAEWLLRWLNGD